MDKKPLAESLQSSLFGIFKASGIPISVQQNEAIGREAETLANILEGEIKYHIIQNLEKIQDRLVEAFRDVEGRLSKLEE